MPETGNFILQPSSTRACLDITIQSDELFEMTENLFGEIDGFLDSSGNTVSSIPGITVRPDQTEIQISDLDGKVN